MTQNVLAVPDLTSISPTSVTAGAGNTLLTATSGSANFVSGDTIYFQWRVADDDVRNASTLTATITASGLTTGGQVSRHGGEQPRRRLESPDLLDQQSGSDPDRHLPDWRQQGTEP